jgi:hypothetical protein
MQRMDDREELNAHRSERLGAAVDEAEHFYTCKACGQAVDKRRLGDVFHHEEAGHEPIPPNA